MPLNVLIESGRTPAQTSRAQPRLPPSPESSPWPEVLSRKNWPKRLAVLGPCADQMLFAVLPWEILPLKARRNCIINPQSMWVVLSLVLVLVVNFPAILRRSVT